MNSKDLDPYIIVEGGLVQNDPALPVFDLDGLVDQDIEWIQDFYERLLRLLHAEYDCSGPAFSFTGLPHALRDAMLRAEEVITEITEADSELLALARSDGELLAELFDYADSQEYGERTAQALASRVLGSIGIAVPQGQDIVLTDVDPEPGTAQINTSQLQYATEQYNLATGEAIRADSLEEAIGWL